MSLLQRSDERSHQSYLRLSSNSGSWSEFATLQTRPGAGGRSQWTGLPGAVPANMEIASQNTSALHGFPDIFVGNYSQGLPILVIFNLRGSLNGDATP